MKPTDEQIAALDAFRTGGSVAIEALAGTGKTTTLKLLTRHIPSTDRVLYTAFGASVIADARGAFPDNVHIKTNHALAYPTHGAVANRAGRLNRKPTPKLLIDALSLTARSYGGSFSVEDGTYLALGAVTRFLQSADPELTIRHVRVPETKGKDSTGEQHAVLGVAKRIWSAFADPKSNVPITHDVYLKSFQLSQPRLRYDVLLLDEAQDASAVVVDILTKQTHAQLCLCGDRAQQIYAFRGAINAMTTFHVDHRTLLTQSFRYGNSIAEAANAVLAEHCRLDARVRGNPAIDDRLIAAPEGQYTLIARTNSTLIEAIVRTLRDHANARIGVVGGVQELSKLVDGAAKLLRGERPTTCPDLMDFATWDEVREHASTDWGRDVAVLVKLVDEHGTDGLANALRAVEGNEARADECHLLLSTAHKAKGAEWSRVVLANDFPTPNDADLGLDPRGDKTLWDHEQANLLYVSATRAKQELSIAHCDAWADAADRYKLSQPRRTADDVVPITPRAETPRATPVPTEVNAPAPPEPQHPAQAPLADNATLDTNLLARFARQTGRPLCILDLETTGLAPDPVRVVEIGYVIVHPTAQVETFSTLVNPGMKIPQEAIAIHGITDADVASAKPFGAHAARLRTLFDTCTIAGFGSTTYDVPVLQEQFRQAGMDDSPPPHQLDVLEVWKRTKGTSTRNLTHIATELEVEVSTEHRALGDVATTVRVLDALIFLRGSTAAFTAINATPAVDARPATDATAGEADSSPPADAAPEAPVRRSPRLGIFG